MATSSEAVVYDTIVSIALIIDQREGETWTDLIFTADSYVDLLPRSSLCYHAPVYANQETFLS